MKKITWIAIALLAFCKVEAQVVQYQFEQLNGTYAEVTGTDLGVATGSSYALSMDDVVYPVELPFAFSFNGASYSQCTLSSNGFLTFGGAVPGTTLYTPISGTTAYEGAISAWGRDINAAFIQDVIAGSITTAVVGTAPNREFVVQFKNYRPANTTSTTVVPYINFQIRLSETTNAINIIYGESGMAAGTTNTATTMQIGLRGSLNTDFNNRKNTTSEDFAASIAGTVNGDTQAYSSVDALPGLPYSGLQYKWTPQACFRPTNVLADNFTSSGVTISWTAASPAPANGYDYYYSTSNSEPSSGVTVSGSVNPGVVSVALTGLPSATTHYVWVRAKCAAGVTSAWSVVRSFTTLCISPEITSTTPGTICGTGTATLGVTTATGFQSWYAAATGGEALGNGATFTTPTISANTNFYVSAESVGNATAAVGLGASTTTDSPYDIANGGYGGMKGQYVFTASELRTAGLRAGSITSLGVEFTTAGASLEGFTIQMGTTSLSQFPTPVNIVGDLTTVFEPITVSPTVGINTLPLTSPFVWDGTSNIIVSTSWSNNNSSNTASTIKYDVLTTYSSQSIRRDNQTAEFLLSLTGVQSSGSSQRGQGRPKVIFGGTQVVSCASPRVAVAATITAAPELTLSSATVNICQGITSDAITIATGASNYTTFTWTPAEGVTGNAANGWQFNPTATTTYTLVATGNGGCTTNISLVATVAVAPSPITVASTTTCLGNILPLVASGGLGNVTLVEESFTGSTTFPSNWVATAGAGDVVAIVNAATAGGTANELKFTGNSQTNVITNRVAIGPFNTAGAETLTLSWRNYVNHYQATYPYSVAVQTSSDGVTWNDTSWITNPVTASQPAGIQTTVINTTDVGSATLYVAFTMSGRTFGIHNWNIDDVKLEAASSAAVTWSPVTYLYSDAAATVPYVAGTSAPTVYYKSITSQATAYTITSTNSGNCSVSTTATITVAGTDAPTGAAEQSFEASSNPTVANLAAVGENVRWYYSLEDALSGIDPLDGEVGLADGTYYATQTIGGCRSNALTVTVTITQLGTQSFAMSQLQYHPNPVVNVFNLKYVQNITGVEVYNMIGQRVLGVHPNTTVATVNMEQLPAGTYVVLVKSGQESKTIKLVKN